MKYNTDPRATRTRDALHSALLKLVEQKPFDQVTVREITTEANIGYATFFRQYENKEQLLEHIASDQIQCLINLSVPILVAQDMRSAAEALFSYVSAHRLLWSALITGGAYSFVREEFIRLAREAAVPLKPSVNKVPTEMGVILIVSGLLEILSYWLRQTKPMPIRQIAELYEQLVVSPIVQANSQA